MLVKSRVDQALHQQAEALRRAARELVRVRDTYLEALGAVRAFPPGEAAARLAGDAWPGARPTGELDARGLAIPAKLSWDNAQEARLWALDRLRGVTTVAVDGSQIAASKEFGVPLSLVQVAWFQNHHDPDRDYTKDVYNLIVTAEEEQTEADTYAGAESKLNQRRFALEMRVAVERLEALAGTPRSLVLVDGSLVLSFAGRLAPLSRQSYLQALFGLLDASQHARVPVVGYVDLSFASDVVTMLRTLFDLPGGNVFDARIVEPFLDVFGRTAAFQCARGDVLPHYHSGERDYSQDLCFVYLKAGAGRLPARLDFPRWILEAGLLDWVLDVVRAEIVVGSGYPYALETADAAAVLTLDDRLAFYRLVQDFAQAEGLTHYVPTKSISKGRRR